MTFSAKLGFKNPSSSQDLNETQAKIIGKGIYDGGSLGLSGVSLNITIAPFVAVGYDGMVVVSDSTETVTVIDGQLNYIVLLAKYEQRATPTIQFQVLDDVTWAASIHSDYFINWAKIDLSSGGYSGVTSAEVYYDESDWSEKVGKGNWKSSVATTGDLPTIKNLDGDTRMVASGYKPYIWKSATKTWEPAFDSVATLVSYAGGPNWHDGTTNPATTVEAQFDKIITDLIGETSGGGADKIGCGSRSNWLDTTTNPVGSVYDALGKIITDLSATTGGVKLGCQARNAWHDGTTNPTSSIYGALDKIITDLVNSAGSDRIGAASASGSPYSLSIGSIRDQLLQLLGYTNAQDALRRVNSYWCNNWQDARLAAISGTPTARFAATDGTQIAIVCQNGSDIGILWSKDGITFRYRTLATSRTATGIAYGNGYWVVTCSNGSIYHSAQTDLYGWVSGYGTWFTEVAITGSPYLTGAAYGNGYWVLTGNSGALFYRASTPAGAFTSNTQGSIDINEPVYCASQDIWVLVGDSGLVLYRATNPTGIFTSNNQGTENLYDVAYGTYNGSVLWVITGANNTLKTAATVSGSWTDRTSAMESTCSLTAALIANETIFASGGVLLGGGSYPFRAIQHSIDGGATFSRLISEVGDTFGDLAYGNNRVIATSYEERVLVSHAHIVP